MKIETPLPSTHGEAKFPRRACLDAQHPVEQAIRDASMKLEHLGADLLLTQASTKLQEARELVADWLEGKTGA